MATSLRIIGLPVSNNSPVWAVDHILWWRVEDFIGKKGEILDPRFRESVDSSLYLDYVGIFNKEEFTSLNEKYKQAFLPDPNWGILRDTQIPLMAKVDEYLRQRLDVKYILVEQYEWETGMN